MFNIIKEVIYESIYASVVLGHTLLQSFIARTTQISESMPTTHIIFTSAFRYVTFVKLHKFSL